MSEFFNRAVKLTVGDPDFDGLEISELRVTFNVEKSLVGYPNLATIQVYNLSPFNRNLIKEEFSKVLLQAGYADSISLIFSGEIINVTHQKIGVDWVTTLFCGDSIGVINTATINKTLPAGSTVKTIYDELVTNMDGITKGVTEGVGKCIKGNTSLLRSINLSGDVKEWLDKISQNCGFVYSINDGVIETAPKDATLNDEPIKIVSQDNGMIGSPELTEVGLIVKSLLLPQLKLARRIELKSISSKVNVGNLVFRKIPPTIGVGVYRIDKLNHVGDTHGNDWYTRIEGRRF